MTDADGIEFLPTQPNRSTSYADTCDGGAVVGRAPSRFGAVHLVGSSDGCSEFLHSVGCGNSKLETRKQKLENRRQNAESRDWKLENWKMGKNPPCPPAAGRRETEAKGWGTRREAKLESRK